MAAGDDGAGERTEEACGDQHPWVRIRSPA